MKRKVYVSLNSDLVVLFARLLQFVCCYLLFPVVLFSQHIDTCKFTINNKVYVAGREFTYELITDVPARNFRYGDIIPDSANFTGKMTLKLSIDSNCFYKQTGISYSYYYRDSLVLTEWTGLIENRKNVWIHPPRSLIKDVHYAPFFHFKFKKKKWNTNFLTIGNRDRYISPKKILFVKGVCTKSERDTIFQFNGVNLPCSIINIEQNIGKKKYFSKMLFNETYGFVSMDITFITDHHFSLRLLDCIDP